MYLFKLECLFFLETCPEVKLLDHKIILFLLFLRNHHTVFQGATAFYISISSAQGFQFLHILASAYYFLFFFFK